MNRKHYSLIGAALGLATFLGLGLLPSLLFGGYAGVLLATGIFGSPVHSTLAVRALIVGGMVFGTLAGASLFTVAGAVVGAGAGVLVESRELRAHPVGAPPKNWYK